MEKYWKEKLEHLPEIKENFPKKEVAFAFVKPDFLEHLPEIKKILKEHALEIAYSDKTVLSEKAVDYIYQKFKNLGWYEPMKKYLTTHDSGILFIIGQGLEAQKVLSSLKKTPEGKDGILREKFGEHIEVSDEDYKKLDEGRHPKQEELSVRLSQANVIHTADSSEEALESLRVIFGDKFETMKKRGILPSELWEVFEEDEKKNK